MGGGLMQLVAYGAQDVYLSGNPQITFFKVVYRRHTNFAVEPIPQTWNGSADFGRTVTCNINRNGDLITNMYLCVELAKVDANAVSWGYVNRLGHALIQNVKIEIGGSKIDEHYADWLNIWYELTHETSQERGYAKMIGDDSALTTVTTSAKLAYTMYIPLIFWFNRNNGLALPLIALQYHDVRITLIYNSFASCINYKGTAAPVVTNPMKDSFLVIDYVYLDSEERKRFAQASHEYLIEQLQFTGSESLTSVTNKYRLNFNHPCKYLVWASHFDLFQDPQLWLAYAFDGDWSAAKDYFAKVLSVMTGKDLDISGNIVTAKYSTVSGGSDAGGLAELLVSSNISTYLSNLVNQSDVQWSIEMTTPGTNILGSIATQSDIEQLFGNAIVTRNNLSIADITVVASTIYNATNITLAAQTTAATAFAKAVGFTVVNHFNYANNIDKTDNPVYDAKLQLNGHDRFQNRDGSYFNYVQPYQHFTHTPADGINVYSFALKAEDHQPTGSCNFSRIDNATLNVSVGSNNSNVDSSAYTTKYLTGTSSVMNIYTVNYNVLRVMSGMAGTAYSN
jgi:hypothetical protein